MFGLEFCSSPANDPNGNNRVVSYTYDAVGNRLTKADPASGVTTTYTALPDVMRYNVID